MLPKARFQNSTIPVILMALILPALLMVPVIVVNAIDGDSSDYRCDKIDSSKTIGQVECCDIDLKDGQMYCTICDGTNPPSNCSERYPHIVYKEEPLEENDQSVPSLNAGRGTIIGQLSDQELEQVQPSESQDSGISNLEEGLSSDPTVLGEATFNTLQENEDSNEEANNNTS